MGISQQIGAASMVKWGVCTSTTRPQTPYQGQHIYETDTNLEYVWNGSAWVQTYINGNSPTISLPVIDNFKLGFTTTVTSGGTTTLTNTSNNQQVFTGSATQDILMPVYSTMTVGMRYVIENNSAGIITVRTQSGTAIVNVASGTSVKLTSILNTGGGGPESWDMEYVGFNAITGTGSNVLSTSPTLTGTPTAPTAAAGTNTTQLATTAFANTAGGLVLIKSQAVGSGVTSVSVTDAFSSTYDNYRVVYSNGTAASASSITFALTGSSAGYYTAVIGASYTGGTSAINDNNSSSFSFAGIGTPEGNSLDVTLYNPFVAYRTGMQFSGRVDMRGGGSAYTGGGFHNVTTSYSGFTITCGAALTGGTIYVYGFRK